MSASQEHYGSHDEIDLIELLVKLWRKRLFIALISFLCGCIGLGYLLLTPGKYSGEFVLRGPAGDRLATYAPLNDGIKEHYAEFLQNTGRSSASANLFEISTDGLVTGMVRELQDLEEFEAAVKEYNATYRNMSDEEFFEARGALVSNISIIQATERDPEVRISFNWRDKSQLLDILVKALSSAEENLNSGQLRLLTGLADNVERRTLNERENLARNLVSVMEATDLETAGRLLFLKEQASIARELDLAENNLTKGSQENLFSFKVSEYGFTSPNRPETLYLRGYKSLEREIDLIESREGEEKYLLDQAFLNVKRDAIALENDESAMLFREAIETSPFALGSEIFNIKKEVIRVKNTRNAPVILIFSLLFGLLVSCAFVLISGALQRHNSSESA
ncbi:MAG: Wzz/FepE/Etk N-terminal domain-containing protein [Planktotalea sp.]|uniref:Wzz/FepE/Etk N-terminal domain-containing protein n=1 Tax=Planktotalea sp. TaxID=2029877 RepID=UPI003C779040